MFSQEQTFKIQVQFAVYFYLLYSDINKDLIRLKLLEMSKVENENTQG